MPCDVTECYKFENKKEFDKSRLIGVISALLVGSVLCFFERFLLAIICMSLFLAIGFLYPIYMIKRHKNANKNYYRAGRDIKLSLLCDHLEECYLAKIAGDFEEELHFPYEKIEKVTETQNLFMFHISRDDAVIVPKRELSKEEIQQMRKTVKFRFVAEYTCPDAKKIARKEKRDNKNNNINNDNSNN